MCYSSIMKAEKEHTTTHRENMNRLARIEGQVRGIKRLVEDGAYCVDILTQIQAAQSALSAVSRKILHKHLDHCVAAAMQTPGTPEAQAKLDEVMTLLKKRCG